MSILKRVYEAIYKMEEGDFESALIPAFIAVAAMAEKQYPHLGQDNQKFKAFITDNIRIIGTVAYELNTSGINLGIDHPKLNKKKDPVTGAVALEDIIYHAMRCSLIHTGELHKSVKISEDQNIIFKIGEDNILEIGPRLINGLIMAVILSPKNAGLKTAQPLTFNFREQPLEINFLFGKKDWFEKEFLT